MGAGNNLTDQHGKLVVWLGEQDLAAVLVSRRINVRYFSGFAGSAGVLVVTPTDRKLFVDFRYVEQARQTAPAYEIVISKGNPLDAAVEYLREAQLNNIGFEAENLTVAEFKRLVSQIAEPHWRPVMLDSLRAVKTPEEIEKRLGYARRCTAHLEHIIYIVEPHERSPAYIAAAPSGMATSCTVKVPGRIKPREIGAKAYVAGAVGRSKMQVAVALPGAVEAKAVKARAFTAGTVERSHTAINIVIGGQTT